MIRRPLYQGLTVIADHQRLTDLPGGRIRFLVEAQCVERLAPDALVNLGLLQVLVHSFLSPR